MKQTVASELRQEIFTLPFEATCCFSQQELPLLLCSVGKLIHKSGTFTNLLAFVSYITCLSYWPQFWVINPLDSAWTAERSSEGPTSSQEVFLVTLPIFLGRVTIWGPAQSLAPPVEGGTCCKMGDSSFAIFVVLLVIFLSPLTAKPGAKPLAKSDPGICICVCICICICIGICIYCICIWFSGHLVHDFYKCTSPVYRLSPECQQPAPQFATGRSFILWSWFCSCCLSIRHTSN